MIIDDEQSIKDRVAELTGRKIYGPAIIVTDTTDYMRIAGGMILRIADNDYFVTGDAREGRFGIDDQPKFWVKYAYDLTDGSRKVIKLVFYEDFSYREGVLLVRAHRSPEKEARCLEIVRDDPRFMQGFSVRDPAGNLVRILEYQEGKSLYVLLHEINMEHEQYFHEVFPGIMKKVIEAIEALKLLEDHGEQHGDVRNDHIIIDKKNDVFKWIDFDYHVSYDDYDIWSCGNIITYATARRIISFQEVIKHPERFPDCQTCKLTADDALLFYKYRVANLKKLYPYIPDSLNRVVMNFSQGTYMFYEEYDDLLSNLKEAMEDVPGWKG